jgi:hypothetical protein
MKKNFFIGFLIAPCIFSLLSVEGFSQNNGGVRVVDAEGTSIIINNDIENARNNAIRNALQRAVEYAVLTLIPRTTAAEKSQVIRNGIYAKSDEYIHDYRIVGEKQVQTIYKVDIKSTLFVSSISDDLQALGLLAAVKNNVALTSAVVTVRGLENYADYTKVRELLKTRVSGVRNYQPQRLERGMARLIVNIQGGNIQSFADGLMKTGQFSLDNMSVDQNYIEVTFLKQK